jgi:hypothetical protein
MQPPFAKVYRMRKCLFLLLHDHVSSSDDYFEHKTNCMGVIGLSSLQKTTAAMRMHSLGTFAKA